MEGQSRPTFFRGVATVVTKLFNIVQPDLSFFGQKDIQQCLLLRRMISDLHLAHPSKPSNLRIVPTVRDFDDVALSSRNAYLTPPERQHAPVLYNSLKTAKQRIDEAFANGSGSVSIEEVIALAHQGMTKFLDNLSTSRASPDQASIELDYIKMNDPLTLKPMNAVRNGEAAVLSGAFKIGRTRLIDNVLINIQL